MYQIKSVSGDVSLQVLTNGAVLTPRGNHADAAVELNDSKQLANISMTQPMPRNDLGL